MSCRLTNQILVFMEEYITNGRIHYLLMSLLAVAKQRTASLGLGDIIEFRDSDAAENLDLLNSSFEL